MGRGTVVIVLSKKVGHGSIILVHTKSRIKFHVRNVNHVQRSDKFGERLPHHYLKLSLNKIKGTHILIRLSYALGYFLRTVQNLS